MKTKGLQWHGEKIGEMKRIIQDELRLMDIPDRTAALISTHLVMRFQEEGVRMAIVKSPVERNPDRRPLPVPIAEVKQVVRDLKAPTFEIAPKTEHGVDYGVKGIVLMRHGNRRLVWRKGHSYWNGGKFYEPANLYVLGTKDHDDLGKRVFECGRLNVHRLHKANDKINELMGTSMAPMYLTDAFKAKKTLIVEEA